MGPEAALVELHAIILLELKNASCKLLGGWYAYGIQVLLGFVALATLLLKWWLEVPKRALKRFGLDASKQALGALLAHFLNMLFADVLTTGSFFQDACVMYFVFYIVDSAFGLVFNWVCLRLLIWAERRLCGTSYCDIETSPGGDTRVWTIQIVAWCSIVIAVKAQLLFTVVIPFKRDLYRIGAFFLAPFDPYPRVELLIVMIVIPLICNVVVFWWTDMYLMPSAANIEDDAPFPAAKLSPEERTAALVNSPHSRSRSPRARGGSSDGLLEDDDDEEKPQRQRRERRPWSDPPPGPILLSPSASASAAASSHSSHRQPGSTSIRFT